MLTPEESLEERTRIERRKRRRTRRVRRFVARLMLALVLLFIVIVVGSGLVVSCSHTALASPSQTNRPTDTLEACAAKNRLAD